MTKGAPLCSECARLWAAADISVAPRLIELNLNQRLIRLGRLGTPHPQCGKHDRGVLAVHGAIDDILVEAGVEPLPPGLPTVAYAIGVGPLDADGACLGPFVAGRGVDWDRSLAVDKAVSEYVERLACLTPNTDRLSWWDGPDARRGWWCEAQLLETGEQVLVPWRETVLRWVKLRGDGTGLADSTGSAAHPDRQIAIELGWRETLERHALRYASREIWLEVDLASVADDIRQLSDVLAQWNIRMAVKSYASHPGHITRVSMVKQGSVEGSACSEHLNDALRSALFEAIGEAADRGWFSQDVLDGAAVASESAPDPAETGRALKTLPIVTRSIGNPLSNHLGLYVYKTFIPSAIIHHDGRHA